MRRLTDKASEFTIEANPESLDEIKLALFLENGINRISIGIQSFNDVKLKKLGRIHDGAAAVRAVDLAHKKGFKNISIDLMSGVIEEKYADWKKDLHLAANLPVKHISCYCIDCKRLEAKEEIAARMYEYTIDWLPEKGFKQYEISNFAKDGYACKHNLTYWNNDPYIGLGPSAVSYMGGRREENVNDVADYVKRARSAEPLTISGEKLKEKERAKETAAVKIRTMEGIDLGWFRKKTGFDLRDLDPDALRKLLENGLIRYIGKQNGISGVALTRRGILLCDIVSSAFL